MREINTEKKKRWVSLYVENRIGVLARIFRNDVWKVL